MADKPYDRSRMSQSMNTAEKDIQTGNPAHVFSGNKYFILLTGVTLNSHVDFIVQLEQKTGPLKKVNNVDECDFILAFCPVVSRAGTDIESAEKMLHATSATKPAVLVVLHHTFDPDCFVPNSCRVVKRANTVTVDCLFHEDQGVLCCLKNTEAINHIQMQIKPKVQKTPEGQKTVARFFEQLFECKNPQIAPEYISAVNEACMENKQLEDFRKKISKIKSLRLCANNELIIATELKLVLLGKEESDRTAAKNIILGKVEMNHAAASTDTATQQSESTQVIAGTKVMVVDVDSPGLSLEELNQTVEPQAFLLVIPVRYLEDKVLSENETQMTLRKMEENFGTRFWRNNMILFTVSDQLHYKKVEEFIQSGDQEHQRLLDKSGNRFHCLNIKESEDGSQVSQLLEKIEKMVEGNKSRSEKYQIIRNVEERHAWVRKIKIQIQKALEKCEQYDKAYVEDINSLVTSEISAHQIKMVNHLRNQYKIKKEIAEQMEMMFNTVAKLEENRQFIKTTLPENQQPIWLSLPDEEPRTLEKYNMIQQLVEEFLEIMGKSCNDK